MSTITSSSSSPPPPQPPPPSPPPSPPIISTSATFVIPERKPETDSNVELQIFLGGSCNPTTWRRNVAIPYLEMEGISYYNPQVDNWTPEVVNLERYAKQNAKILLFVIDKQTRSTVSIVESAFMGAEKKNLVLVVYPFEYNIVELTSDIQSSKQTSNIETRSKSTKASRAIKSMAKSSSSSLSSSSSTTSSSSTLISTTADKSNQTATLSSSTTTTTLTTRTTSSTTELDDKSLKRIHEEASLEASGRFKMSGEVISLNEFKELKQARYILQTLVALQKIPMFSDILQALEYVSCCLSKHNPINQPHFTALPQNSNSLPNSSNINEIELNTSINNELHSTQSGDISSQRTKSTTGSIHTKDLYLSLDTDDHLSLESSVIPILKEKGLTYNYMYINKLSDLTSTQATSLKAEFSLKSQNDMLNRNEQLSRYSDETTYDMCEITRLALEKEIRDIQSSRVLLFVITNKCRGLSIMVLASHFMALFRNNVVLCVQYLEEPCCIGGETLTESAIADYNRGRIYLSDYAVKSQVPVFGSIREAIECCSRKCRYGNKT